MNSGVLELTTPSAISQYGFQRAVGGSGNHYNSREFLANMTNSVAMALLNRDLEQAQWERNTAYNDPSAQYRRLTAAGMNPVTAMSAIAGVGNLTPQTSTPSGQAPNTSIPSSSAGLLGSLSGLFSSAIDGYAKTRLLSAQAKNQEIKNEYEVRRQEGETGILRMQQEQMRETLPETIAHIKTKYYNDTKLGRKIDTDIDLIAEQISSLQLTNKFNDKTLSSRVAQESRKLENLIKDGRIKEADAALADLGIVLGKDGLSTLLGIIARGNSPQVIDAFKDFIVESVKALPSAIGEIFRGIIDGVADAPKQFFKGLLGDK